MNIPVKFKKLFYLILLFSLIILTFFVIDISRKITLQTEHQVIWDILAAVVSISLGSIVTMALLKAQSENEEIHQRNSIIFNEKLKIFKDFMMSLGRFLEDGTLNESEIRLLIMQQALVSMNINNPTNQKLFDETVESINIELTLLDENGCPNYQDLGKLFHKLADIFRAELYESKLLKNTSSNYENFYEISSKKRHASEKFLDSFDEFIRYIIPNAPLLIKLSPKNNRPGKEYKFKITPETPAKFKLAYEHFQSILKQCGDLVINEEFLIDHTRIYKTNYLMNPKINFSYMGKKIIRIGMSNANRIFITLINSDGSKFKDFNLHDIDDEPKVNKLNIKNRIPPKIIIDHIKKRADEIKN